MPNKNDIKKNCKRIKERDWWIFEQHKPENEPPQTSTSKIFIPRGRKEMMTEKGICKNFYEAAIFPTTVPICSPSFSC